MTSHSFGVNASVARGTLHQVTLATPPQHLTSLPLPCPLWPVILSPSRLLTCASVSLYPELNVPHACDTLANHKATTSTTNRPTNLLLLLPDLAQISFSQGSSHFGDMRHKRVCHYWLIIILCFYFKNPSRHFFNACVS